MSALQGPGSEVPEAELKPPAKRSVLPAKRSVLDAVSARVGRDLVPRIGSGLVLAALAMGVIVAGPAPFGMLLAVVCGIVGWEWSRIVRGPVIGTAMLLHVGVAAAAVVVTALSGPHAAVSLILVGALVMAALCYRRHPLLSALGVLAAGLPGVALLWLRSDATLGVSAILFLFFAVAATDIAAYFSGRLIGGPKLWPRVSPNKTWAGLIGAMAATGLVGAVAAQFIAGAHASHLLVLGGALALVAQAGDLGESALKRHFGVKDSSNLIPGHGGFMDRADGLASAAVLAALLAAWLDPTAPAHALLTW